MLYQLPNGKTINISVEDFFTLDDDEFHNLVAYNIGEEVNNPFHGSTLPSNSKEKEDIIIVELPEDI